MSVRDDAIGGSYNLRARLLPALVVFLPLGLAVMAWVPVDLKLWGTLGSLGATLGVAALLQQWVRDLGRQKQLALFQQWGGKPSVCALSYRFSTLNRTTLSDCHARLREFSPGLKIPASEEEEARDFAGAMSVYESCNDVLLEKTRDTKRFALLFEENMNFGFRRNLLGVKPYGLSIAMTGVVACPARVLYLWWQIEPVEFMPVLCAAGCLALALIWAFLINPQWVRRAAEVYANRLVVSCLQL
jgi:hypothetical protein